MLLWQFPDSLKSLTNCAGRADKNERTVTDAAPCQRIRVAQSVKGVLYGRPVACTAGNGAGGLRVESRVPERDGTPAVAVWRGADGTGRPNRKNQSLVAALCDRAARHPTG